jgi:hypothetical protein
MCWLAAKGGFRSSHVLRRPRLPVGRVDVRSGRPKRPPSRFAHAREHNYPWCVMTCAAAASSGLHTLQFVREHGCEWDQQTCAGAARGGHLSVLRTRLPVGQRFYVPARNGHQDVLAWCLSKAAARWTRAFARRPRAEATWRCCATPAKKGALLWTRRCAKPRPATAIFTRCNMLANTGRLGAKRPARKPQMCACSRGASSKAIIVDCLGVAVDVEAPECHAWLCSHFGVDRDHSLPRLM